MCGRYTLTIDKSTIEKRFGANFYIAQPCELTGQPTYNAAPSQLLPIIRTHHHDRIELAQVGLRARGLEAPRASARRTTPASKPRQRSRCSPAHSAAVTASSSPTASMNGRRSATRKQPYRIMLKTGEPFAMAGIYARGHDHEFGDAENTLSPSPS